jgi:hypothetical protein
MDSGFEIGDFVEFTNDNGVKFYPLRITGFRESVPDYLPEHTVYIDSNSPWMPVKPSSLRKIEITKDSQASSVSRQKMLEKYQRELGLTLPCVTLYFAE